MKFLDVFWKPHDRDTPMSRIELVAWMDIVDVWCKANGRSMAAMMNVPWQKLPIREHAAGVEMDVLTFVERLWPIQGTRRVPEAIEMYEAQGWTQPLIAKALKRIGRVLVFHNGIKE